MKHQKIEQEAVSWNYPLALIYIQPDNYLGIIDEEDKGVFKKRLPTEQWGQDYTRKSFLWMDGNGANRQWPLTEGQNQ